MSQVYGQEENTMNNHIRWVLIGLSVMFGLQSLVVLIFVAIFHPSAQRSASIMAESEKLGLLMFGMMLGTFTIGGFVIGWLNRTLRVADSWIATICTLVLCTAIYVVLPEGAKARFVTGQWLTDATGQIAVTWQGLLFLGLALVAATIGAYLGYLTTVPEGSSESLSWLIAIIGAIVGPFIVIFLTVRQSAEQSGAEWYLLGGMLLVVAAAIAIAYWKFTRKPSSDEDISISPERAREGPQAG
jgi:hypothetical protein